MDDILLTIVTNPDTTTKQLYYTKNHLNSTVAITNETGKVLEEYIYDVFGKAYIRDGNSTNHREFKKSSLGITRLYTGREYDSEINLYFLRARYYNPVTGRFISRDPIDIADDVNLYAYVGNNGVMFVDLMGLEKSSVVNKVSGIQQVGNFLIGVRNIGDSIVGYPISLIIENENYIKYNVGKVLVGGGTTTVAIATPVCIGTTSATLTCGGVAVLGGPTVTICIPGAVTSGASCGIAGAGIGATALGRYMMNSSNGGKDGGGGKGKTGGTSKTTVNVKVQGGKARVDIEYPTGGSTGNVHVQFKGKGGNWKEYMNSLDDINNLPKSIRNNQQIIDGINKAFRNLENAQKTMK